MVDINIVFVLWGKTWNQDFTIELNLYEDLKGRTENEPQEIINAENKKWGRDVSY